MMKGGGTVARMVGALMALGASTGCRAAMTTTIENRGDPLAVSYLCGDAMYETTLASGASVSWTPVANACTLDVHSTTKGRSFTLRNACRHSHGCSVGVTLPAAVTAGAPATSTSSALSGSGQIDVVGSVATVTAAPPP